MPSKSDWFWIFFIAALILATTFEASAAEMRIQHTSKITGKTTSRVLDVAYSTCIDGAYLLRSVAVGKVRVWCNGRRV